ncbi:hypothetical protein F5880DRAFT_455352 [Lentinula raphanica]|nr:hypothetical protein F5880DRAFT_455352 [Lentinula raphanica]
MKGTFGVLLKFSEELTQGFIYMFILPVCPEIGILKHCNFLLHCSFCIVVVGEYSAWMHDSS